MRKTSPSDAEGVTGRGASLHVQNTVTTGGRDLEQDLDRVCDMLRRAERERDEALALLKTSKPDEYYAMKGRQADEIDAVIAANPGGNPELREILEHASQELRDAKMWDDAVRLPDLDGDGTRATDGGEGHA